MAANAGGQGWFEGLMAAATRVQAREEQRVRDDFVRRPRGAHVAEEGDQEVAAREEFAAGLLGGDDGDGDDGAEGAEGAEVEEEQEEEQEEAEVFEPGRRFLAE